MGSELNSFCQACYLLTDLNSRVKEIQFSNVQEALSSLQSKYFNEQVSAVNLILL